MQTMPSHSQGLLRTCLQYPRRTQRGMKRTPSSLLLGKSIKINVKYKLFRMCLSVSYSSQVCTVFQILFFFFQRKNDPKKFQDLENRFTDPKITKTRECQVLKSLQKRILEDMQQSEIIVNYLADKYDNEPEKKRVKFSSLH